MLSGGFLLTVWACGLQEPFAMAQQWHTAYLWVVGVTDFKTNMEQFQNVITLT